jgi:antitoxin component HigA of HigAB toxin-antitoxin module
MTTRNEPSIGNLVTGLFTKAKVSHTVLVEEALDAFTKAEQKMSAAIDTINIHIDADNREVQEINERIESSNKSKDRITRVLDRVKALTA